MWEEVEAKTGLGPVMGLGTALGETGCLQVVFITKLLRQETRSILLLLVTYIHLRLTRSLFHETRAC